MKKSLIFILVLLASVSFVSAQVDLCVDNKFQVAKDTEVSARSTDQTFNINLFFIDESSIILEINGVLTSSLEEGDVYQIEKGVFVSVIDNLFTPKETSVSRANIIVSGVNCVPGVPSEVEEPEVEEEEPEEVAVEEVEPVEEPKKSLWQRFLDWLKGLFTRLKDPLTSSEIFK